MEQVDIIVAKDQLPMLLAFAGKHRIFHQIEIVEGTLPEGASQLEGTDLLAKAANLRNRSSTLANMLQAGEIVPEKLPAPLDNMDELGKFIEQELSRIEAPLRNIETKETKLGESIEATSELAKFLSGLQTVGVSLESLGEGGFLATIAGETSEESVPILQTELDKVTSGNTIFVITRTLDESVNFLAIFPTAFEKDAKQVVAASGAKLSPPLSNIPGNPAEARQSVDQKLTELKRDMVNLDKERESLRQEYAPKIKALSLLSEILELRARAMSAASATESTTILRGWVPRNRLSTLMNGAPQATDGLVSIHVERDEPRSKHVQAKHDEPEHPHDEPVVTEPPTLIQVPSWSRSLQSVIDNFGLPSYGETNPLPFMLFSFPVIFGLMFGDYGEGIVILALGIFLLHLKRNKTKIFEIGQMFVNAAELIIILAISMIGFGLVFGDFFGLESQAVFGFPALFSPTQGAFGKNPSTQNLLLFMTFILFFGVAHYLSGLMIAAYNRIRAGHFREAFFGPIAWAWFYSAFIYLAAVVVISGYHFGVLLSHPIEIVLLVIPLGLLGYWEGGLHAFEVFISAGSNTLSYLRIWALNLADFAIKFAFLSVAGIAGLILANLLIVMILEGLIVFVQTLRLHWVEWFSKFYEGTGLPFAPYQEPTGWIVSR
jgi:V/A-type H+-transporting ATPase subunit I